MIPLCALVCALVPALQDSEASPLRLRPVATIAPTYSVELPMRMRGVMPAVEVFVNGEGPFLFAIDTGGQGSARLDSSLVETLGLEAVGSVQGADPSGRATRSMDVFEVESLVVGEIEFEGVRAASRDYNVSPSLPHIDGILGYHLFSELVLTLDYPGQLVSISSVPLELPDGAQGLELLNDPDSVPVVRASVAGLELDAVYLDTGKMGGFGVPLDLLEGLELAGEKRSMGRARSVTGEFEFYAADLVGDVRVGDVRVENPTLDAAQIFPVAIIGSRFLSPYVLTLDPAQGLAWLRTPEHGRDLARRMAFPAGVELDGLTQVPIRYVAGRPWVDLSIDGDGPFSFLIDTGASTAVVDTAFAAELSFESLGAARVGGPSSPGGIETERFLLETVELEGLVIESLRAVALDLKAVFAPGGQPAPHGILGLASFGQNLVTFDKRGGLLLIQADALPEPGSEGAEGVAELEWDGGLPSFEIRVGEEVLRAHLDTGAPGELTLPSSWLERLPFSDEPQLVGHGRTVSASFEIHAATLDGDLSFAGHTLENPRVTFASRLRKGNLGGAFLDRFLVTYDLAHERIRFDAQP